MLREARAILNVHTTVTATGFGEISIPDVHWTCPCPPGACSGGCHCHCPKCASRVGGCPCPLICSTKACPCLCNKCFQSWNGAARERGRSEASEERKKGKAKDYSKTYRDKKLGDASSLGARASPMDISNLDSVARITRRERRGPASKGTEVGRGKGSHPPIPLSPFPQRPRGRPTRRAPRECRGGGRGRKTGWRSRRLAGRWHADGPKTGRRVEGRAGNGMVGGRAVS